MALRAAPLSTALVLIACTSLTACIPPGVEAARKRDGDVTPKTRVAPWTGGEDLNVGVPGEVRYVQGPANQVQISGPTRAVDRVEVEGSQIYMKPRFGWWAWWRDDRLSITVTAPRISSAHLSGSGRLVLGQMNQDRLSLGVSGSGGATAGGTIKSLSVHVSGSGGAKLSGLTTSEMNAGVSGSGWITAAGVGDKLDLSISGSGHANMSELTLNEANVQISGSGSASLAPKQEADVGVSGSGHVSLLTEPVHLSTHRSGSGSISHPGGASGSRDSTN